MIRTTIEINDYSTKAEIKFAISHLHMLLADAPVDAVDLRNLETVEQMGDDVSRRVDIAVERDAVIEAVAELNQETLDPAAIFGGIGSGVPAPPATIKPLVEFARESSAVANPTGELDVAGHAWDERIHSGTRAKNKDGTWRTKRGVSAGVVAQVENERKQSIALAPGAIPPPPPVASPPAVSGGETGLKFNDVVRKIQDAINAGKLTQARAQAECKTLGLEGLPQLAKRPDLFTVFLAHLEIA